MAQATVLSVTGNAVVVQADGTTRALKVGDVIQKGETIRTAAGARVELMMEDGQVLAMGPNQAVRVDETMAQTQDTPTTADAAVQTGTIDQITQVLEQGGDLTEELEAAAAGAGGGAGGDGSDFVRLLRVVEGVDPLAYDYTFDPQGGPDEVLLSSAAPEADEPVVGTVTLRYILLDDNGQPLRDPNGGFVYIDGDDVIEGTPVGLVAQVDVPPTGSPLVLTLSNGQTITIPVGEGAGFVPLEIRGDDQYIQGRDLVDVAVTGASGGQYDQLNIDQSTNIGVVDDNDPTAVTLNSPTVDEGGNVTITATVDNAPQGSNLVLTLSNSQQITILAGQTSGSVTFAVQGDDPYVDGETFELTIENAVGGNYEALDIGAVSTVTVQDTKDTVNLTIVGGTALENEEIVFTIKLDQPLEDDLKVTLDDEAGTVITIKAGDTEYEYKLPAQGDDVYEDGETVTLGIKSAEVEGKTFENLVIGAPADVVISDTKDTVNLTIVGGTALENEEIVFTIKLDQPLEDDLKVTLDDEAGTVITIKAGDTEYEYKLPAQGDDVYEDGETVTLGIKSAEVEGKTFENLVIGAPADVVISDTIDTTTATLSGNGSIQQGGSVEYTVDLSDPVREGDAPVIVTLSNGLTIEITAGPTGKVTDTNPQDGQVVSIETVTQTPTEDLPGSFEKLDKVGSVTVDIDYDVTITGIGATGGDQTVYENDLAKGTSPNASALRQTGTFTITALDGIASVLIQGTSVDYSALAASGSSPITITGTYGTLVITGYQGTIKGGEVSYTYTLNKTVDNDSQSGATGIDFIEKFNIKVTDTDGDNSAKDLTVRIVDDVPVLDVRNTYVANQATGASVGTLVNMGADVGASTGTTTTSSVTWTSVAAKITTTSGVLQNATLTSAGEDVLITREGNKILGKTEDGDSIFTITANADGTYSVQVHRAIDSSKLFDTDGRVISYGTGKAGGYILYEGEGNQLQKVASVDSPQDGWLVKFSAVGSEINMSANGMGVDSGVIKSGDRMIIDVNDEKQFSAVKISFNQQIGNGNAQYIAYFADGSATQPINITTSMLQGGSLNDLFIQAPSGTYIDKVEIIGVGGGSTNFKIDGLNFFLLDVNRIPSLDLTFDAKDSDGDAIQNGSVTVTFDVTPSIVEGTAGNDAVGGTSGHDTLVGGAGNDILIGGLGNDILEGGAGADVFVWKLGDAGASGAKDVIRDFNVATDAPSKGGTGDVIDIRDLIDVAENATSLAPYLSFANVDNKLALVVDVDGSGSGTIKQTIVFDNVDVTSNNLQAAKDAFGAAMGLSGTGLSDTQLINKMLTDGHLKTDL